jgi:hypothetical protein
MKVRYSETALRELDRARASQRKGRKRPPSIAAWRQRLVDYRAQDLPVPGRCGAVAGALTSRHQTSYALMHEDNPDP